MEEIKKLDGYLNSDDAPSQLGQNQHAYALNGRFRGNSGGMRFVNVEGNIEIPNSLLPVGDNECIGSFFDELKQRIIWANWNSNGRNAWYHYDIKTGTISSLLTCFTDSTTDILGFDLDYPIASINIVYRTDVDGDIMTWVQRNKRPKELNIKDALARKYGSDWIESYLDVAKAPPSIPIKCAYEDDSTVIVNNLKKGLHKAKYRFWYDDSLKSVWSSHSEIPLPYKNTDPQIDTDPIKNCRIGMIYQTGGAEVRKVEIAVCDSNDDTFSDFYSVIILDKAKLSIPDNDTAIYRFYNNEAYSIVDVKESILLFDYVPDLANTQELLNGNVIVYGGITEGKDPVSVSGGVDSVYNNIYTSTINTSSVLSVTQNGLEGFQSGNIHALVVGKIRPYDIYSFDVLVGSTTYTITYTAAIPDTPANIITGLAASATGQGFTVVSSDANNLIISRATQVLLRHYLNGVAQNIAVSLVVTPSYTMTLTGGAAYLPLFPVGTIFSFSSDIGYTVKAAVVSGSDLVITTLEVILIASGSHTLYILSPLNTSIPVYAPSSKYNLGIVYYDEKGKTNGVSTDAVFNVNCDYLYNLVGDVDCISAINAEITNRPPLYAKYFQFVRSLNLTKSNLLYWISDRTYKDSKFAYISIESINSYKKLYPSSIIAYDFSPNDRIKFTLHYNPDNTVAQVYQNQHDYEIFAQVINPDINGVTHQGQFLQIVLPETSGGFDFNNGTGKDYFYYRIELYTPQKPVGEGLETYYEFSERYEIGNAGTTNAYHQGELQNQTPDLVTPATFKFKKGDDYYRQRSIQTGNVVVYDMPRTEFTMDTVTRANGLPNSSSVNNRNPTVFAANKVSELLPDSNTIFNNVLALNTPTTSNKALETIANTVLVENKSTSVTKTYRVTGSQIGQVGSTQGSGFPQQWVFGVFTGTFPFGAFAPRPTTETYYVVHTEPSTSNYQTISFSWDILITVPPNSKVCFYKADDEDSKEYQTQSGSITFTEVETLFKVGCIDRNFSDFYRSAVNSNGRPLVVQPDERTAFYPTVSRWGLAYLLNTNINQLNRFYPLNFVECDKSKGDIQRFKVRGQILRVFQNRACGQYGIYTKFIQDSSGTNTLTTTDDILTKFNIQYYEGEYGLGDQYTGLVSGKIQDYFVDPVRGYQVRLSGDGLQPISVQNKGQFYIRSLIVPYNEPYLRANGSRAKILGAYNYLEEEYVAVLQSGTLGGLTIADYTFSFNEKRNAYCSFFEFYPEWIQSAQENIYTWLNGKLYIHNNTTNYTNYYGVQKYPSLTIVFNNQVQVKKTFLALSYQANQIWQSPTNGDILTSQINGQTNLPQISQLKDVDFEIQEYLKYAALLRDANSGIDAQLALVNGDELKGVWAKIKLTYLGSQFAWLFLPTLTLIPSPRN